MPRLIFTQPEFRQKFLELCDGAFSVGRSGRNQIIIEDASVSKEHADLLVHGNEIIVRERGSQNGTFVGGARIKAQSGVKHGEKIRFGRVESESNGVRTVFLTFDARNVANSVLTPSNLCADASGELLDSRGENRGRSLGRAAWAVQPAL